MTRAKNIVLVNKDQFDKTLKFNFLDFRFMNHDPCYDAQRKNHSQYSSFCSNVTESESPSGTRKFDISSQIC